MKNILVRHGFFDAVERLKKKYVRFFSLHEIEDSIQVQYASLALIITFFFSFSLWNNEPKITVESYLNNTNLCWPYFTSCGKWYFLHAHPYGYSSAFFFGCIFVVLAYATYSFLTKRYIAMHASILMIWIIKVLITFLLTQQHTTAEYYEVILGFVLLFLPYKYFFLQLSFVGLYYLSAIIKFHDAWITGTFFSALQLGLPLIPDSLIPIATNIIIAFQCVEAWFLMSARPMIQRAAFWWSLIFHFYSVIIVGFRFPLATVPLLITLFGPYFSAQETPLTKKSVGAWVFIALISALQFVPIVINGDHKLTQEGNHYALHLFEANHQCITKYTAHFRDGAAETRAVAHEYASYRCYPYREWFTLHQFCERNRDRLTKVEWTFDHSINGRPFYRIVDTQDACSLHYTAFGHNDWIRLPEEGAVMIGVPVKNYYEPEYKR